MSVATHLGIDLAEYDARIRTFIPHYEEMLQVAADAIEPATKTIVDLGIGTGALSARCLRRAPKARIVGIDADREVLKAAGDRLPAGTKLVCSTFEQAELPRCDAMVASFALHHIRTQPAKAKFYRCVVAALHKGGQMLSVDCHPATDVDLAQQQHDRWKAHLLQSYPAQEAAGYLDAWSHEDVYVPLAAEIKLMEKAGLAVEVLWRKEAFAVLRGRHEALRP